MAQIKAWIKIDKEGIEEYVDEYFDIEPDVATGELVIKVPAEYEPQDVSLARAYQWSFDMSSVAQEVSTITSVENLSLISSVADATSIYTTRAENMFNGCSYLEDYTFLSEGVTSFNNTYRNTPNIKDVVRIAPHAKYLDNCFNSSGTRKVFFEGAPDYLNNCFYNAKNISAVEFEVDMTPYSYGNFLEICKDDSNRLDIYMPDWRTYTSEEHYINTIFKTDASTVFGNPITWDFDTAAKFGIYYNKDYQIYVHYELPQPTDRKGIFLNPDPGASIIGAYRTSRVTDII